MIPVYPINYETNLYIKKKLQDLADEHEVKVLLAIESGSRAWGFPSTDSDYDVRFIYVRKLESYLSVKEFRDVIETPIIHDDTLGVPFDINGWDLRKALQLAIKSNPVLIEWLVSPVKYCGIHNLADELFAFAKKTANTQEFRYHYDRLARNAWEQIQQNQTNVKVKLYCYALRPAMATQWIQQYNEVPPMDIISLCNGLIKEGELLNTISSLISKKATAKEGDVIPRNSILDLYIESILKDVAERPVRLLKDNSVFINEADDLFRRIIKSIWKIEN